MSVRDLKSVVLTREQWNAVDMALNSAEAALDQPELYNRHEALLDVREAQRVLNLR